MISPLPSYDDDFLNSAYANISLLADEAWSYDREDPFRKLNRSLWIKSCEVTAKYEENGDYRPRLVRDVISESRLAKYGNYEYDERRERMYRPDDGKSSGGLRHFRPEEATEPWMLPEVQEHFARSAPPALKCDSARREDEKPTRLGLQSSVDWSENSKKRRQKVESPKESGRAGSQDESLPARKHDEGETRERSTRTFAHRRYTVETAAEMQLRSRIESDAVRDIWNPERLQRRQQCQQQAQQSGVARAAPSVPYTATTANHHQQFYCTLQYQPLILKTEYQRRPLQPPAALLSAEVPEFFPKSSPPPPITHPNSDQECSKASCQMRYFPSVNDRNYQSELFPHNRSQQENAAVFPNARVSMLPTAETNVFRMPQEWIQRIVPPMQLQVASSTSSPPICTSLQPIRDVAIAHRPFQMYERFLPYAQHYSSPTAIPVYQRPSELYQEPTSKRKSHGVDFNNLILLTKSSSKTRRGHMKGSAQQPPLLLESTQRDLRSGQNTAQWLDRDCARRTKDVVTVNALVSELRSFEGKYEHSRAGTSWATTTDSSPQHRLYFEGMKSKDGIFEKEASRCRLVDAEERDRRTKRPLYRDVLANTTSGQHGMVLENIFERKYDELEQQAMEQYRNSEESLALKYQELERQAMEQYKNGNTVDEKQVDSRSASQEDQDCLDGRRCSRYGQCSPSRRDREKKDFRFPQVTLLRPKGRSLPNVFQGSSIPKGSDSNHQSAVISRSLSTLTDRSSKKSKNISKGASGDKIDTIQTSSKRRLILVSPFERKSEPRVMETTDLREICSLSQAKENVFDYYRSSEVAQNGSGDESIMFMQPPNTEGTMGRCR
ncbi:hypothetical protein EAI_16502 [Harpegnathos saltator]|uniref:Uncharacterized protein n=1 Tax=Harpegnathos saltator TaxID=610380 RepID=E2C5C1_HARSA|nr:hypothetical protein EAI_16502 [Harpegnathos saltator]